jgi:hypothetical protein
LPYNSFYVFASQIATASQPVISLLPNASHPKSGTGAKEKDLFFEFIVPLLPVRQWQSHKRMEWQSHELKAKKLTPFGCLLIFYNQCPSALVLKMNIVQGH